MNLLKKLTTNETQIIKEIHDSFDNAQELLLQKASDTILTHTKPTNLADKHKQIGFINSKIVTETKKSKNLIELSTFDIEKVNHYKSTYPFLKFLKEEQLDTICKKYELIYAPISNYIKNVPEKNLIEIENAQPLKSIDNPDNKYFLSVDEPWLELPNDLNKILSNGFYISPDIVYDRLYDTVVLELAKKYGGYTGNYHGYTFRNNAYITEEKKEGLFIAAPKSHFDLSNLNQNKKGFFKSIIIKEIKDPIVFRYVKGGIQVLSKWGLEGEDEVLQIDIPSYE